MTNLEELLDTLEWRACLADDERRLGTGPCGLLFSLLLLSNLCIVVCFLIHKHSVAGQAKAVRVLLSEQRIQLRARVCARVGVCLSVCLSV